MKRPRQARKDPSEYEKARKRNIRHSIRLTREEEEIVRNRMEQVGINSFNMFAVSMMTQGLIIVQDLDGLSELTREINKIGVNINQIAHNANALGYIQNRDIDYIKAQMKDMRSMLINHLIKNKQ